MIPQHVRQTVIYLTSYCILVHNQSIKDWSCENKSCILFKVLVLTFHNFETNWPIFLKFHRVTAVSKSYNETKFQINSMFRPQHSKTTMLILT